MVARQIDAHCAWLDVAITALDVELVALVEAREGWRTQRALLESVPGVGLVPEITLLAATRCTPVIRAHFGQLRARGKAFKVAMVACIRKLLTILNAILRQQRAWQPLTSGCVAGSEGEGASGRGVE